MPTDPHSIAHDLLVWLQESSDIDHPIAGETICARYRLKSTADVRDVVNWLRSKGDFAISRIGSDNRGYYWLKDWDEAQPTVTQLMSRSRSIDEARRGICRAFKRSEEQGELVLQ